MVCLPCIMYPVLLWVWFRFIQPILGRFWDPNKEPIEDAPPIDALAPPTDPPFDAADGTNAHQVELKASAGCLTQGTSSASDIQEDACELINQEDLASEGEGENACVLSGKKVDQPNLRNRMASSTHGNGDDSSFVEVPAVEVAVDKKGD